MLNYNGNLILFNDDLRPQGNAKDAEVIKVMKV